MKEKCRKEEAHLIHSLYVIDRQIKKHQHRILELSNTKVDIENTLLIMRYNRSHVWE